MTREKVAIKLEKRKWSKDNVLGYPEGTEYTAVNYTGSTYGAGSPCTTQEEIDSAIKNAKETIREHNDIPIIKDNRLKQQTLF